MRSYTRRRGTTYYRIIEYKAGTIIKVYRMNSYQINDRTLVRTIFVSANEYRDSINN